MAWTISVILIVLWGLGRVAGSTEGAWVHLFLAFGLVAFVLAALGRRTDGPRRR
jgi:uncharacterized protein (DUF58 family)